jgi:phospholipase A-2-activating protein
LQVNEALALSESELTRLHAIVATLKDTSHYHTSSFAEVDFNLVAKLLLSWPVSYIFPGVYF